MKQIERLLFLQGQRCFFCRQSIPTGEASIEHLLASSNGGSNEDDNCVVCCKSVNAALGNLTVKAKLQAVLIQTGAFSCPRIPPNVFSAETPKITPSETEKIALVVADLQKRGSNRPRRVSTLRNTIAALFQKLISDDEVTALLNDLENTGRIAVVDTKVSYNLSHSND